MYRGRGVAKFVLHSGKIFNEALPCKIFLCLARPDWQAEALFSQQFILPSVHLPVTKLVNTII